MLRVFTSDMHQKLRLTFNM